MTHIMNQQILYNIMVINLKGDVEKLLRIRHELEGHGHVSWTRIEAVYGSSLPDDVCIKLTRDPYSIIAKGAVGCFLSHVRAWELLANSGHKYALVIEDDANILDLSPVQPDFFPPDFDIIFSNDRTNYRDDWITGENEISVMPIELSAARIERRQRAVGTDSYILSRLGAKKLLEALSQDLYFGHVDLRLFAYCTRLDKLELAIGAETKLYGAVKNIQSVCRKENYLNGYSLSKSITSHTPVRDTSRTREDRLGMSGVDPSLAKSRAS
jgi:GR25 family glycosyltransferase involved in LPS biosynthesis